METVVAQVTTSCVCSSNACTSTVAPAPGGFGRVPSTVIVPAAGTVPSTIGDSRDGVPVAFAESSVAVGDGVRVLVTLGEAVGDAATVGAPGGASARTV